MAPARSGGVLARALHRPRRVDLINRCVGLNESQSLVGREGLAMALCERRGVESFHVASDLLQAFHAACIRGVRHGAPFERLVPARGRRLYGTGVVRRQSIDRLGRRWRGCRRKFDIASSAGTQAGTRAECVRAPKWSECAHRTPYTGSNVLSFHRVRATGSA